MFAAPFKWLLIQRSNDTDELLSRFADVGAYPDSELTVWQKEKDRLLSIYRTNDNSSHLIEERGSWRKEDGRVVVADANVASRRRRNLGGIGLKSCLVVSVYNIVLLLEENGVYNVYYILASNILVTLKFHCTLEERSVSPNLDTDLTLCIRIDI